MQKLYDYFKDWSYVIDKNILDNTISNINSLYNTKLVMPYYKDIFKCFTYSSLSDTYIIIIGQDPYPQKGIATGLAFANSLENKNLSPSLQIIKDTIESKYKDYTNYFDVSMEHWANQGILLLNSSLTVECNKPGSHCNLWRPFIKSLIQGINRRDPTKIYILLGDNAKFFKPYIDSNNIILEDKHPAYYSRNRLSMPIDVFEEAKRLVLLRNNIKINYLKAYMT